MTRAATLGLTLALLLAGTTAFAAAQAPDCISCHSQRGITGSAIRDWKLSKHATQGVGCADCHLTGDLAAQTSACEAKGVVRAVNGKICAQCHGEQAAQFAKSKHAAAWVAMEAMPTTKDQPRALMDGMKGCGGCHRVGYDSGRCDSCHTRHLFSAAEARRPEACATCHMGFDHPQWEMYSTSKHGILYQQNAGKTDWSVPLGQWFKDPAKAEASTPRAPTCAFCHMPKGDHGVKTSWGFLALRLPEDDPEWMADRAVILQALGVLDKDGKPTARLDLVKAGDVARLSKEEWQARRDQMIGQCSQCHAPSFAKQELGKGDEIIKAADHLMAQAITEVYGLYRDGVLPEPKDRPFSVDVLRFYEVDHPIEQKLYVMLMEHRMRTFQGAFHMNPDYQHWYGWAEMKRDLAEIKAEAAQLRAEHAKQAPGRAKTPAAGAKASRPH
jgi:hydroxylamine dehydrogenase